MNVIGIKRTIVNMIPKKLSFLYYFNPKDISKVLVFLLKRYPNLSYKQRLLLTKRLYIISHAIDCRHAENEILSFIGEIASMLDSTPRCIVEAGCYKGGSTAKFSIAAKMMDKRLVIFDSFEGLPEYNDLLDGDMFDNHYHPPGSFYASINEVKKNIDTYGELEVCEFIKGWYEDTMPGFSREISAVFLDVALASSTRTCLKYLYPLLVEGGILYSNDGYSPPICSVFSDDEFWQKEVGCLKPDIQGLGRRKLIKIVK